VLQGEKIGLVLQVALELPLPVSAGKVVDPRGGVLKLPVNRELDDLKPSQAAQKPRPRVDQSPDALPFRIDLAVGILPRSAARAITQLFGAAHRAGEARELKNALAAHVAAENKLLENELDGQKDVIGDSR
jgi:hypothetical protein